MVISRLPSGGGGSKSAGVLVVTVNQDGAVVTATMGTSKASGTVTNGEATLYLPKLGTYAVTVEYAGVTTDGGTVNCNKEHTHAEVEIFKATLKITADDGALVSIKYGGVEKKSYTSDDTEYSYIIYSKGEWTVTATKDLDEITKITDVQNAEDYTVSVISLQIVTFADGTDEEIKAMLDAHYNGTIDINEYWAVGDSRVLSDGATYKIIGIEHDDLATPINGKTKAAVTIWKSNNWTSSVMNSTYNSYTYADYATSAGRTATVALLNNLSTSEKAMVKPVTKLSAYPTNSSNTQALKTSTESIFLLSNYEMFGTTYSSYVTVADGTRYPWMTNNISSVSGNWWSRSGFSINSGAAFVNCYGGSHDITVAGNSLSLAPALCW